MIFQVYNSGLQQGPKTSKVIIPLSSAPFGELGYFVNCSFKIRHMNWKKFNEQHVKWNKFLQISAKREEELAVSLWHEGDWKKTGKISNVEGRLWGKYQGILSGLN